LFSRLLTGRSLTALFLFSTTGPYLFSSSHSPSFVSGNVHSNPASPLFAQEPQNFLAPYAPLRLGEPSFSVTAASGVSIHLLRAPWTRPEVNVLPGNVGGWVCSPCSDNPPSSSTHFSHCDTNVPPTVMSTVSPTVTSNHLVPTVTPELKSHADSFPFRDSRIISPILLLQIHFLGRPHSCRITLSLHKPSHLSPPSLITSTLPSDLYYSPPNPNQLNSFRLLWWNSRGVSSSRCAELCSFISSSRYDLVLLQKTNLSSSRNFKVPGCSVF